MMWTRRGAVLLLLLPLLLVQLSCKKQKDATLPDLAFSDDPKYVSSNAEVGQGTVLTVGIQAEKTKKDLRKFEVRYSYDGDQYDKFSSELIPSDQKTRFFREVKITTRSEQGIERWRFEVSDIDGNTASEEIVLTVN
jgi:hypothetical protein